MPQDQPIGRLFRRWALRIFIQFVEFIAVFLIDVDTINLVVDILYTVVDPRLRATIGRPA